MPRLLTRFVKGSYQHFGPQGTMARMGRPEELRLRGSAPASVFRRLHTVNGQILDGRYPPYMGG